MLDAQTSESPMDSNPTKDRLCCRLCGGGLRHQFQLQVLRQHDVAYFECMNCGSLQTEQPYWLEQAYCATNLSQLDTGAAQRNIDNLVACFAVSKLLGLRNIVDFGGGDGLLCRLLRDYGLNCYVSDKYATAAYAQGFKTPAFERPDLLLAFEVMEHFANPREEVAQLFASSPRVLLLSTIRYRGQSSDWWYLAADSGQHVFFYSKQALVMVAEKYGYSLTIRENYLLFIQAKTSRVKRGLASLILKENVRRWLKIYVFSKLTTGAQADYDVLRRKTGFKQAPD
jgi:2-polyprenyl-3-methyl-5-hydroxy-6-metoxy-1,4-benzoquinol methylase